MGIIDRIIEVRNRKSLSQTAFAKILGVGKNTQIRYEKGLTIPDTSYLKKLSQVTNCDYDWLLTGNVFSKNELVGAALGKLAGELGKIFGLETNALINLRQKIERQDLSWKKEIANLSTQHKNELSLLEYFRKLPPADQDAIVRQIKAQAAFSATAKIKKRA